MTNELFWSTEQLGEALNTLAQRGRLSNGVKELPNPPRASYPQLGAWIEAAAERIGLEAEETGALYGEVEQMLLRGGPALWRVPGEKGFLALLGGRGRNLRLLAPDLRVRRVPVETIRALLCRDHEAPLLDEINALLEGAGVAPNKLPAARAALLRERLRRVWFNECWLLRLRLGASFVAQLHHAGLPYWLGTLVAAYTVQFGLGLLAWWVLGRGMLGGALQHGWLLAWALLLLTAVPLRWLATWAQGRCAISAGGLLKQRLLYGALQMEPEAIRREGAGQMLGRVFEANAVESLALSGGFLGLVAVIEWFAAALVLSAGAAGAWHVAVLLIWTAMAAVLAWRAYRCRRDWTAARLEMTNDMTERMVGHRTRLVQQAPGKWHDGEDQTAAHYLTRSLALDRASVALAAIGRGWVVVALLAMSSAFIAGTAGTAALAVSIGGILLAYRALHRLISSLSSLQGAALAWQQVKPLLAAAARHENAPASFEFAAETSSSTASGGAIIEAHDLTFRYRERGAAVLRGCSLKINSGDRVLLEGASGGGKSTLAALLTGLHEPESGMLLAGGLDQATLGAAGWRRRVVSAPQFHDNHVFTGTFAFNLLLGRAWPAAESDYEEAETLCRQLGLGELLARMPGGLQQMVGETGWQLSHGERSRLFLARALLQKSELVILDESFAALDPATLRECLATARDRAHTLLVIAHP